MVNSLDLIKKEILLPHELDALNDLVNQTNLNHS